MVLVFLGLAAGIILSTILNVRTVPDWSLAGIIGSFILFVLVSILDRQFQTWALVLSLVFFGVVIYGTNYFDPTQVGTSAGALKRIRGKVVTYPGKTGNGIELTLKPADYRGKIKVFLSDETNKRVDYGDEVTVSGNFQKPGSFQGFNYGEYLRKKEIWAVGYSGKIVESSPGQGNAVREIGWSIREVISGRVRNLLPDQGDFLIALILGDREILGEEVRNAFTETGLAHLLAASGLHLGLILGFSWWVLIKFGFERGEIYLVSLPVLFLYLTIVGFKLPLLRASLIYLFGGAHFYLEKSGLILSNWYDRYQALATAALLLTFYNPESITNAGFQLSFGATFALALFFEPIKKSLPIKPDYLAGVLAASIAAQLGVAPVLAVHFGQVHPWAPLANLIAIPAVTVVLYLGFLLIPLGDFAIIGPGLIKLEGWIIKVFKWLIKKLSALPLAALPVPSVTSLGLLSYLVLVLWLKWRLSGRWGCGKNQLSELSSLKGC